MAYLGINFVPPVHVSISIKSTVGISQSTSFKLMIDRGFPNAKQFATPISIPHSHTVTNNEICMQVKLVQFSVHFVWLFPLSFKQRPACTRNCTFTSFLFPYILTLIRSLNRLLVILHYLRKKWTSFPVKNSWTGAENRMLDLVVLSSFLDHWTI